MAFVRGDAATSHCNQHWSVLGGSVRASSIPHALSTFLLEQLHMSRLIIAEVSKVRHYHSTVTDGFLKAWRHVDANTKFGNPIVFAHQSFIDCLSSEARTMAECRTIPVIDPDKRWLVRKTLLEAWTTLRIILSMGRKDTLVIATIFPTALVVLEYLLRILPRRNVVVLQHNEVEAAITTPRPRLGSYGHANLVWHRMRGRRSPMKIAVLGSWIAEGVRKYYPHSVRDDELFVLPMPMIANVSEGRSIAPGAPLRSCFVGFNTAGKGFDTFEMLAKDLPDLDFMQIGGGVLKNIRTGETQPLSDTAAFMDALARCDVAIMPNTSGYDYTLSAAATDALAAGLHLIAYDRKCFRAMQAAFGGDAVTICTSASEIRDKLASHEWREKIRATRSRRLSGIDRSEFGLTNVGHALERIFHSIPVARDPQSEAPSPTAFVKGDAAP